MTSIDEIARQAAVQAMADVDDLADVEVGLRRLRADAASHHHELRRAFASRRMTIGIIAVAMAAAAIALVVVRSDSVDRVINSPQDTSQPSLPETTPSTERATAATATATTDSTAIPVANGWQAAPAPRTAWVPDSFATFATANEVIGIGESVAGDQVVQTLDLDTSSWTEQSSPVTLASIGLLADDRVVLRNGSYDVGSRTWSTDFPVQIDPNDRVWSAGWTGEQALFLPAGLAYAPATNVWQRLDNTPTDLGGVNAVWTGSVLIGAQRYGDWFAYDPVTGTWTQLPSQGAPNSTGMAAVWDGQRLVVLSPLGTLSAYSPTDKAWTSIAAPALPTCPDAPTLYTINATLIVRSTCDQGAMFVSTTVGGWTASPYPDGATVITRCPVTVVGDRLYDPCANLWFSAGAAGTGEPATPPSTTPTTAPTTTAPAPATPDSSVVESTDVDVSTPWPFHATPSGDVAPYLLPTIDLDGLTLLRRYESDEIISDSILSTPYSQTFVGADASSFVSLTSRAQPSGLTVAAPFTTIGPWQVSGRPMGGGWVGIDLVAEKGVVMLTGFGAVTRDDLLDVAAGLRRRADTAPGWDVTALPDGVAPFSEGWQTYGPVKDLGWYDAAGELDGELQYGKLDAASLNWFNSLRVITVGQRQVFTIESDQYVQMFWREPDGTIFRLALRRPTADAVALIENLTTVTQEEWLALPQPEPTTNDGCDSLFC
jgi:hypothetical protein